MRKSILFTVICFALYSSALGQVSLGVEGGLNFASLYGDRAQTKAKTCFRLGGVLDIKASGHIHFQPGFEYTGLGGKITDNSITYVVALHYVQVPLMFFYQFKETRSGTFFLGTGPYFGLAFSGKAKDPYISESIKFGDNENTDDMRRGDFGFDFAVGYQLPAGVSFKAFYMLGTLNTVPGGDVNGGIRNRAICLSFAYFFNKRPASSQPGK